MEFKQVTCPNCQNVSSLKSKQSKLLVCSNCGTSFDSNSQEIIGTIPMTSTHLSDLHLGLKGVINGKHLEIIGYVLYEGWDFEERWFWEEWCAVSSTGYHWLEYDHYTKEYALFEQITPTVPMELEKKLRPGAHIPITNLESFIVDEVYPARILKLAGELPWKAKINDPMRVIDGHHYQTQYSVELGEDEVEFFRGKRVDHKYLLESFGLTEKLNQLIEHEKRQINWTLVKTLLIITTILSGIGALIAASSGKKIFQERVTACNTPVNATCRATSMPLGPIELTQKNKVYKINISYPQVGFNDWTFITLALYDQQDNPKLAFTGDLWKEFWQEGGESGTDINQSAYRLFRLTDPGTYYLDLEIEKEKSSRQQDIYNVEIYENIILSRYFIIVGTIALGILILRSNYEENH